MPAEWPGFLNHGNKTLCSSFSCAFIDEGTVAVSCSSIKVEQRYKGKCSFKRRTTRNLGLGVAIYSCLFWGIVYGYIGVLLFFSFKVYLI